jgi:hypothetical protein
MKAKAKRSGGATLAAIDTSIEKMMSSITTENKDTDESGAIMWKTMLRHQGWPQEGEDGGYQRGRSCRPDEGY